MLYLFVFLCNSLLIIHISKNFEYFCVLCSFYLMFPPFWGKNIWQRVEKINGDIFPLMAAAKSSYSHIQRLQKRTFDNIFNVQLINGTFSFIFSYSEFVLQEKQNPSSRVGKLMVVIWWSPNHTSNYLPKLRWGNHSTVKCSKSNFLEAIIQHNGIFCHLPVIDVWVLLHGSRRREGGKHWRLGLFLLQQDLHLNIASVIFWKYP